MPIYIHRKTKEKRQIEHACIIAFCRCDCPPESSYLGQLRTLQSPTYGHASVTVSRSGDWIQTNSCLPCGRFHESL